MNTFSLTVVTPDGKPYDAQAQSLLVRTRDGDVQILAGHADLVAALGTGRACIRTADGEERFAAVSGGFLTVEGGCVTAVCVTFEYAADIDTARAARVKEYAEQMMREAKDMAELDRAKAKLARALARLQAAEL